MDLIYGNSSTEDSKQGATKRPEVDTGDLPIHLPNLPTQLFGDSSTSGKQSSDTDVTEGNGHDDTGEVMKRSKRSVPIPGTDIVLESKADIDEWINKRKENWMKRISNRREEENKKQEEGTTNQPEEETEKNKNPKPPQAHQRQTRENRAFNQRPRNGNSNSSKATDHRLQARHRQNNRVQKRPQAFNLNNAIIQRELSIENTKILDVIKELFDQGVVPKPNH